MTTPALLASRADRTISVLSANVVGIGLMVAVVVVILPLHAVVWNRSADDMVVALFDHDIAAYVAVMFASVVVHELLHGVAFRYAGGVPWGRIRFGVKWRCLTPYAATSATITASAYRIAALLPGIALGAVPIAAGMLLGHDTLVAYGVMMFAAAGGDFAAFWTMRGLAGCTLVQDSPGRVGCVLAASSPGSPTYAAAE